jgi:AcrR family transcriptional regulator
MSIDAPATPRLRRSPEAARENILAAAEAILIQSGPQHLKLAEVAKAAGVVHATVLHHFGSISAMQTALMSRMVKSLVERIIAISANTPDLGALAGQSTIALFDAFEEKGVARLAAWMELTGEARHLTVVNDAVREVISARSEDQRIASPELLEDFILSCICVGLGVGLFGATLSVLLGKPETRAREMALGLLQARADAAASQGA